MRLNRITISGFRGFGKSTTIDLASDVVLVYGLNGSGKSSLVEAIEWLFFGDISRQRLSRCKSEFQYNEYLRNLHCDANIQTAVEIQGSLNGEDVLLKRVYNGARKPDSLFIDGSPVTSLAALALGLGQYQRPMLAQTEIRAIVDTEQKDRWEQLSALLGFDGLAILRSDLQRLAAEERRAKDYSSWEVRARGISEECSTYDMRTLRSGFESGCEREVLREIGSVLGDGQVPRSSGEAKEMIKSAMNVVAQGRLAEMAAKVGGQEQNGFAASLRKAVVTCSQLRKHMDAHSWDEGEVAEHEFLSKGLGIAKPPRCPFCEAETLTGQRLQEIEARRGSLDASAERHKQLQEKVALSKLELRDLPAKLVACLPQVPSLQRLALAVIAKDVVHCSGMREKGGRWPRELCGRE
jgi:DNA repair ATPase RecN